MAHPSDIEGVEVQKHVCVICKKLVFYKNVPNSYF
jgi:hypothetical protein